MPLRARHLHFLPKRLRQELDTRVHSKCAKYTLKVSTLKAKEYNTLTAFTTLENILLIPGIPLPHSNRQVPVRARPLHLRPRSPWLELDRGGSRARLGLAPDPRQGAPLVPLEGEADHVAPLPANELSRSREEVPVVPHEVIRHHHGVYIIAGDLRESSTENGGPSQAVRGVVGIARVTITGTVQVADKKKQSIGGGGYAVACTRFVSVRRRQRSITTIIP